MTYCLVGVLLGQALADELVLPLLVLAAVRLGRDERHGDVVFEL